MKLLRRTTPVALTVGSAVGVLMGSFQAVDGIFGNPMLVTSFGTLLAFITRVYFLYILSGLVLLFLVNLLLCLIIPKRMREADYARLIEYHIGVTLFLLILLLYFWKDKTTMGDILRHRRGIFAVGFFLVEVFAVIGFISFIIAGAIHQLALKLPPGRLALFISSLAWFMLLFPLAGETMLLAFGMGWHPILQVILLIVIAFILSFIIKLLNRLTHGLIALKRRTWIGFGSFLVVCFIFWGIISLIQPKPSNPKRAGDEINVVILSIDALRADHVGCYGYEPALPNIRPGEFTPNIDKFASEGLLFENAFSTSPWTLASMSSWMTGGWPDETGGTYVNRRLYRAMTTLPEALREEGYVSAAFITNPFMNPATALGRGFSKYWEFFDATHMSSGLFIDEFNFYLQKKLDMLGIKESGRTIVNKQLGETFGWLDDHKDEKFFMWVHLYDPHFPYTPPSPYKQELPDIGGERRPAGYHALTSWRMGSTQHSYGLRRHIVNLYDAEIRFSDEVVGTVLDKLDSLGLTEDTLVIIASDHGEEFFDHGNLEHGHTVYEEVLHVPLIFRLPGRIPEGERISDEISLIDFFPTLLDFTGASVEPKLHRGESLKEAILAGDMSVAGSGQMSMTLSAGGVIPGSQRSIIDQVYPPEITLDHFPEREFMEGGKYPEPGLTFTEIPVEPPDSPEEAVDNASSLMMNAAESRLPAQTDKPIGSIKPEGRVIFAEDLFYFDHDLKSIRISDWKFIHSTNRFHDPNLYSKKHVNIPQTYGMPEFVEGDELYYLPDDPHEMKNVIYEYPDIARYLLWRLKEIDTHDKAQAVTRKLLEGDAVFFGAGLKSLTKGFGYW